MKIPKTLDEQDDERAIEPPLAGLRLSLVGAGKVGSSMGLWLLAAGAEMVSVIGRPPGGSGRRLAHELGAPFRPLDRLSRPPRSHSETPDMESGASSDLLLIAVADDAIEPVARALAVAPGAPIALHTSGSRGAEALEPLRRAGSAVGSWHPLRAFPAVLDDPALGRETWFAIDGDAKARHIAHRLSAAVGGTGFDLESRDRPLYHFAATLAAGGVATLLAVVDELIERRGLPRRLLSGYLALARGALDQVEKVDETPRAITGPTARGDQRTLAGHRRALEETAPELLDFVDVLAAVTRGQLARLDLPSDEAKAPRSGTSKREDSEKGPASRGI